MVTSDVRLPSVSVVIPVLNAVDEIGRLLESLVVLDYPSEKLEIIVVDNGSSDGTEEVISGYPVKVLKETRVRSSYAARNRGVSEATGEWVAFTDADCVAPPGWLKKLLSPPPAEDVGAVAGEVLALQLDTPVQRLTERFGLMKHAMTLPHKKLPCFSTANVAVRRRTLTDLGGFRDDVRFFGDMELSWRMQLQLSQRLLFRPEAEMKHRHRRTFRELWWHGCQHGRGVAFMKRTYPELYKIDRGEQTRRIGSIVDAGGRAIAGPNDSGQKTDRWYAPVFLGTWYLGMSFGYILGSAPSAVRREGSSGVEES